MSPSELARTPLLLVALDFDGTLARLVDEPMTARATPEARAAVDALLAAPDTLVAFVSGRSLRDLRVIAEHDDASPIALAGSHGAEYWLPGVGVRAEIDPASASLRDELAEQVAAAIADIPGAWVEPKTFGFAAHSRLVEAAQTGEVHRRADELVARLAPGWRRREGHHLTEYAFRAEGKDAAVATLRAHTGATAVLFAGDDVTDEDALASLGPGDLGVRVGAGETAATVRVADTGELAGLLTELAAVRTRARE